MAAKPPSTKSVSLGELYNLLEEAAAGDPNLALLRGFKLDFSGNRDFHKVFFSVRCHCGSAALLSVEVAMSKSLSQTVEALPSLLGHLKTKAQQFTDMSCEMHTRLRAGGMEQTTA